jgi:high-affinity iron transporter
MNALSVALQSGSILLREGLEAMLVIAALAAIVRRAGALRQMKELYAGALLAVLASLAAAIVFEVYLNGAHDDRMEAAVMLVASALMLYMSGWLFVRQDPRAWQAEMRQSAERALSSGTAASLALIAFLAVFREGAETVLFLHALAGTAGGWNAALVGGLVGAAVCLVGIYGAMQWLALRLPLRPLFLVTSAFLFIMGLRLIGGAVQELQEQLYVPYDVFTVPDWLLALGINPTWEAVGAQLAVAVAAMASALVMYVRRRLRTAAAADVAPSRVPQGTHEPA